MDKLKLPSPSRVAAYLTALAALAAAVAPVVADLDLSSTAGVLGGALAILGVYRTWVPGWREHEARAQRLEWGHGIADPPVSTTSVTVAPPPARSTVDLLVQVPVAEQPGAAGLTTAWVPLSSLATQPVAA